MGNSKSKQQPSVEALSAFGLAMDKYENLSEIGKGGFGRVYSGIRKDDPDKKKIAIKVIDIPELLKNQGCNPNDIDNQAHRQEMENLKLQVENQMAFEISSWKIFDHNQLTKFLACPYWGNKFQNIK